MTDIENKNECAPNEAQASQEQAPADQAAQQAQDTQSRPEAGQGECDAKLAEQKAAIDALTKKCDDYLRMAQRSQADFENYKRRNEMTRATAYADGGADMIVAILPVMDNFERALGATPDSEASKAMREGILMIQKQLIDILGTKGCKEIPANVGDMFDPSVHNAIMTAEAPDKEQAGKIAAVFQKGYRSNDKVIRYTMVSVFQ